MREAVNLSNTPNWEKAIDVEYEAFIKCQTCELICFPLRKSIDRNRFSIKN